MRKIETFAYTFNELSAAGKEEAINNLRDINVDYDWWVDIYEDAKIAGLKITSFGLDRDRNAKGEFTESAEECARLIMYCQGEDRGTFKTALNFLAERSELVKKYSDGINTDIVAEGNENDFDDECDDLEDDFLKSILKDYAIILQERSEYLQTDKLVIETIEVDGYEFTEEGKLI